MAKKPKSAHDHQAITLIRELFRPLVGQGYIELRAIPADKDVSGVHREYAVSADEIVEFADKYGAKGSGYSAYFGVCKRSREGGKKADCLAATALWVDIDTVNNGWDTEACLKCVHQLQGVLKPSAVVASGGGLHLYWFLNELWPLDGDYEAQAKIETMNGVLVEMFSGDAAVRDVSRVLRLPGTTNNKRRAKCDLVYCYGNARKCPHELMDAALGHKTVLVDSKWVPRGTAEKLMASALGGGEDSDSRAEKAVALAIFDGNARVEDNLRLMWERQVRYKPTRGYIGVDEAVMRTTARLWCKFARNIKDRTEAVDAVVVGTWGYLDNFAVRWDGPKWDRARQMDAIRAKLVRWIPKWEAIQAQAAARKKAEGKKNNG